MPRYFRLVCLPEHEAMVEELLRAQGYVFAQEPFLPQARKLLEEPRPLGGSLAAAFGLIYIQDRSSMLAPLFLGPPPGTLVLDMCASPGSKTGLLAQLVGRSGLVLANEPNQRRMATLRHNLASMNLAQSATCRYPGQDLPLAGCGLTHIQLDPPCSGWGTVARNPRIREIWPDHKLKPLLGLQRELLRGAARLLAPGGRLLYSTCTTNPAENQEQVQWAVEKLGLEISILPDLPGVSEVFAGPKERHWMLVDSDVSEGQGFFFAALSRPGRKTGGESSSPARRVLPGRTLDLRALPGHGAVAWENLPPGRAAEFNGRVFFLHQKTGLLPAELRWQGFELGRLQGGNLRLNTRLRLLLPDHAPGVGMNVHDMGELEALIQGQSLAVSAQPGRCAGSGCVGLYWRKLPLGWLTVKGGRCLWSPR